MYRPPLEHHALNGNSSCIITTLDEPLKICLCSYLIFAKYHALYLSCRNKQIHRQELRISNHWAPMPPHPAATKAQAKRKATKDTKAQPKWQKAAPSSPPRLAPESQAEPADAPKQTVHPSDQGTSSAIASEQIIVIHTQGMSSAIISQEFSSDNCSLYSTLTDFVAEVIPSVDPANPPQDIIQITSSRQRQEIALKQVSYLTRPIFAFASSMLTSNRFTLSPFLRSMILPTAYSPLPSRFLTMKEKEQALHWRLG